MARLTCRVSAHALLAVALSLVAAGPALASVIQADLKAATWTIKHNRFTCRTISARHVIYRIAGTQKWD